MESGIKTPRTVAVEEEKRRSGRAAVRVRVVDRGGQLVGQL